MSMKIAVVTGASSGLGAEFARQISRLYKDLDEIWVVARRRERLETLKEELRVPVRIFEGDLLKKKIYQEIKEELAEEKPDIRMLVNAAGYGKIGKVAEISKTEQLDMIGLNCKALTRMTMLCMPYMRFESRIINLASAAAFCPQPSFAIYAATKSYVLSFSRGLRAELEDRGILVTAVCPGPVDTEFFEVAGTSDNPLKQAVKAAPEDVVRKALIDSVLGRAESIYGLLMKAAKVATKLLPHGLILRIMKKFW